MNNLRYKNRLYRNVTRGNVSKMAYPCWRYLLFLDKAYWKYDIGLYTTNQHFLNLNRFVYWYAHTKRILLSKNSFIKHLVNK